MHRCLIIIWTLLCILTFNSYALAASKDSKPAITYKTKKKILYYDKKSAVLTKYMKNRCRLDLYYPKNYPNFPTVVWFHGGGLREGNGYIPDILKKQKIAVAAVNYRLFPAVNCPAYIEDAAAAVAWVFKNIHKYGGNPDLIFVSGYSAGSYLTNMIGLDKRWLAKHNVNADRIVGLILISGHTITHYTIREERGIPWEQPLIDEFAPLYHVRANAPPLILITGDRKLELLGRYEENAYFMRMLRVAGHKNNEIIELPGYDHDEMLKPAFPVMLRHIKYSLKTDQKKEG